MDLKEKVLKKVLTGIEMPFPEQLGLIGQTISPCKEKEKFLKLKVLVAERLKLKAESGNAQGNQYLLLLIPQLRGIRMQPDTRTPGHQFARRTFLQYLHSKFFAFSRNLTSKKNT